MTKSTEKRYSRVPNKQTGRLLENEKKSHLYALIWDYSFINFQQKFPPIRLFSPIFLLSFKEFSHLYSYSDPSSIRNSRVLTSFLKWCFSWPRGAWSTRPLWFRAWISSRFWRRWIISWFYVRTSWVWKFRITVIRYFLLSRFRFRFDLLFLDLIEGLLRLWSDPEPFESFESERNLSLLLEYFEYEEVRPLFAEVGLGDRGFVLLFDSAEYPKNI